MPHDAPLPVERDGEGDGGGAEQEVDELGAGEIGAVVDAGAEQAGGEKGDGDEHRVGEGVAAGPSLELEAGHPGEQRGGECGEGFAGEVDPDFGELEVHRRRVSRSGAGGLGRGGR